MNYIDNHETNKLLRINTVSEITSVSRSRIYNLIQEDKFPKPVKIGDRAVAWRWSDVQTWLQSRTTDSFNQ